MGPTVGAEINKMKKERISRDRISDLPVELLHHITSPLPFKSIVQTSLLSKRWNRLRLWRSHPHLDFSLLSPHSGAGNFLPEVLSRRPPDSNITTFRLSGCVSAACLQDCVDRVMNQRIEQIELDVDTDCRFELPPSLFYCNTLGVLKLNMGVKLNISRYRGFGLPSPVLFPAVHTLSLTRLCSVWGWSDLFSPSNLPLLRKLCLKDCRGTYDLNINFPGLEILELDGLRLKGLDISGTGLLELQVTRCLRPKGRAKILAPNLRRLYWEDNFNVKCGTESFEDLYTGSVYFPSKPPNPATLQSAAAFISALCFARSLSVRSQVLKILSSMDSEGGLPFCFNNLTTLEIHTHMTKYGATGIICLLRRSPILHSINVRVDCSKLSNKSWDDDLYWRSQSQNIKSIERQLKVARIDVGGTKMPKSAFHLVEFLLRFETALQEMTLTLKIDPADPLLVQQNIRSKIMKFARQPCTNVIISFLSQNQCPLTPEELY